MKATARTATVITSVALAGFMVFVLSSSSIVAAAPGGASRTSSNQWAYGYVKNVSVGPWTAHDGWVYEGNAVLGYSVILNQTNTSASTFELSVHRTMGAFFSVKFCYPSCSSPTEFAFLSYRAWETTDSYANFTIDGAVNENGNMVPAIALLDSSSTLTANLTETRNSVLPVLSPTTGTTSLVDRSAYLGASVSSRSNVSFSPSLGLFPLGALSQATAWSSTSGFHAYGAVSFSYYVATSIGLKNVSASTLVGPLSVSPSGNVTVYGAYAPTSTISFGGVTYPALNLTIVGPFTVREGFILIPSQADLFSSETGPWGDNQTGESAVQMSALDARPAFVDGHVGIGASSWIFDSQALNPADALVGSVGLAPAVTSTPNPVTATSVQGAPQTVPQATTNGNCLTSGTNCPAAPASANLRGVFGTVVVIGAVAAVVGVALIVLVTERRRFPPPTHPNANLYPVGVSGARAPLGSPGSPPAPPAAEDPLDHLW